MSESKLTQKQQCFINEYLVDLNATQAAIRAGYSEKTAKSVGSENLTKPDIQRAIQEAISKREIRTEITQDKVLSDIEDIKRHAMNDAFDAQGNKVMNNYPAALKAAELQGKHLGMWVDKAEITGKNGKDLIAEPIFKLSNDTTPAQMRAMAKALGSLGNDEYDTNK